VDIRLAGPRLIIDGLDDRPRLNDVIKSADSGLIVADILRSDQSRTAGNRVIRRARLEVIMGLAEPVDAVIRHPGHLAVCATNGVHIIDAALGLQEFRSPEWGVSYHDVGGRPLSRVPQVVDERVSGLEVVV